MCWPHVYRNIKPRIDSIRMKDMNVGKSILNDIEEIQWSVMNEKTFRVVYELLEMKYANEDMEEDLKSLVDDFFQYFRKQWVDSPVFRWWEGAHPWKISNNQGIEGTNRVIKEEHTFKRRCPLGNFFNIVDRMVFEWSKKSDDILFQPRLNTLFDPKSGLKNRTQGYQWAQANKSGMEKMMAINPKNKYTISEALEFQLGKVDNIWVVTSSNNLLNSSLKERAKERIRQRKDPSFESFKDYQKVRSSCWILEERDGDFYCDCPVGMKGNRRMTILFNISIVTHFAGKLCKHTVGLYYLQGKLEVTSEVRSVPLGQKRKRGRPKKFPNCLTRSPPVHPLSQDEIQPAEESAPAAQISLPDEPLPSVAVHAGPAATPPSRPGHGRGRGRGRGMGRGMGRGRGHGRGHGRGRGRGVQEQVELSQYELIRENNIREREEVFRNLNIADDVVSCKEGLAEAPGKDKTRGRGNKRKKEVETYSPRRLRSRK